MPAVQASTILWRVSVVTSPEAEEAVAAMLTGLFGQPVSAYADLARRLSTVTVYLRGRPDHFHATRRRLRTGLERIESCGLRTGPASISLGKVPPRDWAEAWKRHFHPIEVGARLLIKPSWSHRPPRCGQATVVLDPGLSFGTGQHPTTAFCLAQLVAWRQPAFSQSLLDIGTGSGILAIAAAQLGYFPVDAIDLDPDAVRNARANARRNHVARRVCFRQQDLARLPRRSRERYGMVCANLSSDVLLREAGRILDRLKLDGRLVLAGILRTEFGAVQRAYEAAGLRLVASRCEKEWRSGVFATERL